MKKLLDYITEKAETTPLYLTPRASDQQPTDVEKAVAGTFADDPEYPKEEVIPAWGDQDVPKLGMPRGYFAKLDLNGGTKMAIPEDFKIGDYRFERDQPLPKLKNGMIYLYKENGQELEKGQILTPPIAIMLLDGRIKIARKK